MSTPTLAQRVHERAAKAAALTKADRLYEHFLTLIDRDADNGRFETSIRLGVWSSRSPVVKYDDLSPNEQEAINRLVSEGFTWNPETMTISW